MGYIIETLPDTVAQFSGTATGQAIMLAMSDEAARVIPSSGTIRPICRASSPVMSAITVNLTRGEKRRECLSTRARGKRVV